MVVGRNTCTETARSACLDNSSCDCSCRVLLLRPFRCHIKLLFRWYHNRRYCNSCCFCCCCCLCLPWQSLLLGGRSDGRTTTAFCDTTHSAQTSNRYNQSHRISGRSRIWPINMRLTIAAREMLGAASVFRSVALDIFVEHHDLARTYVLLACRGLLSGVSHLKARDGRGMVQPSDQHGIFVVSTEKSGISFGCSSPCTVARKGRLKHYWAAIVNYCLRCRKRHH